LARGAELKAGNLEHEGSEAEDTGQTDAREGSGLASTGGDGALGGSRGSGGGGSNTGGGGGGVVLGRGPGRLRDRGAVAS